jgi:hypothetical protein
MFIDRTLNRIGSNIHQTAIEFHHRENQWLGRMAAGYELQERMTDLKEKAAQNRAMRQGITSPSRRALAAA